MATSFDSKQDTPEYESVAQLAQNVIYRVPCCPDLTVRFALRDAYSEFCRLANALVTERIVKLKKEEASYPIYNLVPDCHVEAVRSVWYFRRRLVEGRDYRMNVLPMLTVAPWLVPMDDCAGKALRVECLEMPNSGSEKAPKWFLRKYGDAIAAGALVRLFSMAGTGWANPDQARLELVRWDGAISAARTADASGGAFGNGALSAIDTSEIL